MPRPLKLFAPGPVNVREEVRQALLHPDICHRAEEFESLFAGLQGKINRLFCADESYYSVLVSGSGTAANEAVLSSAVKEDEEVLLIKNGIFGDRLQAILARYRIPTVTAASEWGSYPELRGIEAILARNPRIAWVAMVYHETSTGMINPVHEVGELCVRYGKKYFVDAVSAAGGEHVDVLRNHIDFATSVGGKCVGAFPGSAYVCAREQYLREIAAGQCRNVYLDLHSHYQLAVTQHQTPYTPNLTLFWALERALEILLMEGLDARILRYQTCAGILRRGVRKLGLRFLLEAHMSNTVTSVFLPQGRSLRQFIGELKARGFLVYAGKGQLAELGMFQIANMGEISEADCQEFLTELEGVLQ